MRIPATVGYNGDPIASGFVASYGLDLFDTNLDWETPFTGAGYDYLQLYNFGADPTDSSTFPSNFPPPYVLGIWLLNESTGTNIYDSSLNGFNGALTGSPLPQWTNGVCASALWFSGTNSDAQVLVAPQLSPTNALTLLAWAQVSSNITGTVVSQWTTNNLGGSYSLGYTNSQIALTLSQSGVVTSLVGGMTIADGGWHLITGTYDGTQMVVYLDGSVDGTAVVTGSVDAVSAPILIGQLPGTLNDVQIYSQALSRDAVATFSTLGDGLPDWWKIGYGFAIDDPSIATNDLMGQGISNLTVYQYGLDPWVPDTSYVILNGGQLITTNTQISVDASGSPFPLLLASLSSNMTGAIVLSNNVGSLTVTALSGNTTNYPIYLQYANANTNAIGNQFTVTVTVDTRPPTLSLCPSGGRTLDLSNPLLIVQYGSMPAAINTSSLTVLINGTNMTSMFYEFATGALGNGSNLVAGSYTWSASISDVAGNTATTSGTFTATGTINSNAPVMSNLDIGSGLVEIPDMTGIWLQGTISDTNASISASVNGGPSMTMNKMAGTSTFGYLVPVNCGTNMIILVAKDASGTNRSSQVFQVERGNHYRAAITSPGFMAYANSNTVWVSGYVSTNRNAGLPTEEPLGSVTVNGIDTDLDWDNVDANGNVPFTTVEQVPMPADGSPLALILQIIWPCTNTYSASCVMPYFLTSRTQLQSNVLINAAWQGGACATWNAMGSAYTWSYAYTTNIGEIITYQEIDSDAECLPTSDMAGFTVNEPEIPEIGTNVETDIWMEFGCAGYSELFLGPEGTNLLAVNDSNGGTLTVQAPMNLTAGSQVLIVFSGLYCDSGDLSNVQYSLTPGGTALPQVSPGSYLAPLSAGASLIISSNNFVWPPSTNSMTYTVTGGVTNGNTTWYDGLLGFASVEIDPALSILWSNAANADMTYQTTNALVGQRIILVAQPASGLVITNVQWTIPGQALANWHVEYTGTTNTWAATVSLTNTTNSVVSFFWVDGNAKAVSCSATLSNGQTVTASTTFNVKLPSPTLSVLGVGTVGCNTNFYLNGIPATAPYLHFGDGGNSPGVAFTNVPDAALGGVYQWVQIANIHRTETGNDFRVWTNVAIGLDYEYPYPSPDRNSSNISDSPALGSIDKTDSGLDTNYMAATVQDTFDTWLLFNPNTSASDSWVPLKTIHWGWTAGAARTFSWTLNPGSAVTPPAVSNTTNYPSWSTRAQDAGWDTAP